MLSLSVFYAFTVLLYSGGEPRLQTEDSCDHTLSWLQID